MKRIGIYGGTFNPPHIGHIQAAQAAREQLGLDEVLLIPDRIAPHKPLPPDTPTPEQRLDMVRLAVRGVPGLTASGLELEREGVSYTYQTVEALHAREPSAELTLLMGTDMFLSFPTWRCPERITALAKLGVFGRGTPGEAEQIARTQAALQAQGVSVSVVEHPAVAISSTDLRRLLVFRCADGCLPAGVGDYIRTRNLYGVGKPLKGLSLEDLEAAVVPLLSPNRVAHVLGCRDTAAALARHYGADETDAARAGLLHDITKALPPELQLSLCRAYGETLDSFSEKNPKTLHARTGSLVAERIFGENGAVVSAIRAHTTGKANMTTLEKILYLADYIEPNRDFPGVEELRRLTWADLNLGMIQGLRATLELLKQQGREISPESQGALDFLLSQKEMGQPGKESV